MKRKHYTSDLTDQEWAILAPLIPPAKPGGQPRTTDMREVLNPILVWVDGGFSGADFAERIKRLCGLTIEVVKRPDDAKGFVLLARRWVVERTFAWLGNYRRLSKDYEFSVYSSDNTIWAAMTHLMVRRLARHNAAL